MTEEISTPGGEQKTESKQTYKMGIIYKEKEDVALTVKIKQQHGVIEFEFTADCGKHGTDESIAGYKFTPEELLRLFLNADVPEGNIL